MNPNTQEYYIVATEVNLVVIGRLGQDVTKSILPSGDSVVNISVAAENGLKDAEGQKQTVWFRASVFGQQADFLAQYAHKGDLVKFTSDYGFQARMYTNNRGEQAVSLEFRAHKVNILSSNTSNTPEAGTAPTPAPEAGSTKPASRGKRKTNADEGEDIPF